MPSDRSLDSTWALLADPYRFISRRCERYQSDVFVARLMLQMTIFLRGREAAELFYDRSKFMRTGAAPEPLQKTLFGVGGVQSLDDQAHLHRKQMFMAIVPPDRVAALADTFASAWTQQATTWSPGKELSLYEELQQILTKAVCQWAEVPLADADVPRRTEQLMALFDKAGRVGLGHFRSRLARQQAEQWIGGVIRDIREGRLAPSERSAASIIARHRSLDDRLLDERTAAVELLNVLRPTVAVAVFIVFVAHALHTYPAARQELAARAAADKEHFVLEVKRFYPFFPAVVARVRETFTWNGFSFPRGRRVMLDLYGTNHDPRLWTRADAFLPERFAGDRPDVFTFMPQGGADADTNHRCPGEEIATELMKASLDFLAGSWSYEVPDQDLQIDFQRLPALPKSHFRVRVAGA